MFWNRNIAVDNEFHFGHLSGKCGCPTSPSHPKIIKEGLFEQTNQLASNNVNPIVCLQLAHKIKGRLYRNIIKTVATLPPPENGRGKC
jgi:hypothetical protein